MRSVFENRRVVWGALAALLVLAVVLLLLARKRQGARGSPRPPLPAGPVSLRVLDAKGEPARTARASVEYPEHAPEKPPGEWSPDSATLVLPPAPATSRRVVLEARGHRTVTIEDPREDRTVLLPRGLLLRVQVAGAAYLPGPPYAFHVAVEPAPPGGATLAEEDRNAVLELMDAVDPLPEGAFEFPRRAFGYVLDGRRAMNGLLLPEPGRYRVRWGLFHEEARTWYALASGAEQAVDVAGSEEAQAVVLELSDEAIEQTQRELDAQVERIRARAAVRERDG